MSYEDTNCPCGGKKLRDTMLCDACEQELANHPSMKVFKDRSHKVDERSHAAHVLVTLSRSRGRRTRI